jgi:hypothetical protein
MMKGLSKMKLKQAAKAALSASPLILGMAATAPAQYYVSHAACGIASGILVCNTPASTFCILANDYSWCHTS